MFKTLVELGVGSFRSRKNSVEFFYGNIDWQLLTSNFLKFLGHTRWGEKEETASPFRLFHSLHLEFESSSRPIRTCEKTLRHWKMYYYDNGHFAINIPICLISINALAITTTGFDQHRVGKPRELSRETEVLMVIAKSRLVTVSASYNLLYQLSDLMLRWSVVI